MIKTRVLLFGAGVLTMGSLSSCGGGGSAALITVNFPLTRQMSYRANNVDLKSSVNIFIEPDVASNLNLFPTFTFGALNTDATYTWPSQASSVTLTFVATRNGTLLSKKTLTISGDEMKTYIQENRRPEATWTGGAFQVTK